MKLLTFKDWALRDLGDDEPEKISDKEKSLKKNPRECIVLEV